MRLALRTQSANSRLKRETIQNKVNGSEMASQNAQNCAKSVPNFPVICSHKIFAVPSSNPLSFFFEAFLIKQFSTFVCDDPNIGR